MSEEVTIKVLCAKLGISVSELARRYGRSPQAFGQKLKHDGFSPKELHEIAQSVGCEYESTFILPDGEKVTEKFFYSTKGEYVMKNPSDTEIERKCRYRLAKHNLRARKYKGPYEMRYVVYAENTEPEDSNADYDLKGLIGFCEQLQEKEADYKARQRERKQK